VRELSERTGWIALAAVMLLGLGLRLGWDLRQPRDAAAIDRLPDQREYLELGEHLLTQQGFWFVDPRFDHAVQAYRTPGYPILIRLCQADPTILRAVQAGLDVSTILAIFLLARRWLRVNGALLAAILVALNPYLIFFSGLILSETLFTAMLCWGIALLAISGGPWPAGGRLWSWLAGGLLLALAVLVRPGAIVLPVLLGSAAALANRLSHWPYRTRWPLPVATTMLLLSGVVLFPWAVRNRLLLGSWVWTATNAGITRYDGFNPDATGASDQSYVASMPWTRDMTEVARCRYFGQLADDWIRAHPAQALSLAVAKIARTWSPIPLSNEYRSRRMYVIVGLCYGLILDLSVVAGLGLGGLPGPAKRLLLLPAIYFTVAAALSVGSLRYRIPAEPPMAILAASSVSRIRAYQTDQPTS
jgi:4-amino-4-deoxy-L-arabinose transferase-like glycosyltransferase